MAIGPVQMLVLGFAEPNFTGKIAAELDRLRQLEFIKIVDALVVNKDENGVIPIGPELRIDNSAGDSSDSVRTGASDQTGGKVGLGGRNRFFRSVGRDRS